VVDPTAYQVQWQNKVWRAILRGFFRGLFRALYQVKIDGLEHIPSAGPYVAAYNHISVIEPAMVLTFWPVAPEAVAAADVWERRGQSTLVRLYGTIPVHRGEMDRQLIRTMLSVLDAGLPLTIAPEGGRSHVPGLRRALPGVGYLFEKAAVPVLPVGIVGSTADSISRAFRGRRPSLEMHIGPAVVFPALLDSRLPRSQVRQKRADQVMACMAALLPEDYRGVYARDVAVAA
jgi:1-acyl-sn-glycerol-3-phosphate acyltransferase